jgi:hypothetical protein
LLIRRDLLERCKGEGRDRGSQWSIMGRIATVTMSTDTKLEQRILDHETSYSLL